MQTLLTPLSSPITNSRQCFEAFLKIWKKGTLEDHERFYVIYLNSKKEIIFYKLLSIGNYNECIFDFRRTLKYAFNKQSNYIIIAHNHPDGFVDPSPDDIVITNEFVNILSFLQITLVDHIILCEDRYVSLMDIGLITKFRQCSAIKK